MRPVIVHTPPATWISGEAFHEGWDIFSCDDGFLRVQRLDDPAAVGGPEKPMFDGDAGALEHVKRRAAEGSDTHKRALLLHMFLSWE